MKTKTKLMTTLLCLLLTAVCACNPTDTRRGANGPSQNVPFTSLTANVGAGADAGAGSTLMLGSSGGFVVAPSKTARCVITVLPGAYSGNGTGTLTATTGWGAIASQNGVTIAAGDTVFLAPGATNETHDGGATSYVDEGPYTVINPGATGDAAANYYALTRPIWWSHGSVIPAGVGITIGGEDTLFGGSTWRAYAAKGAVVDTVDPVMYPDTVSTQVVLAGDSGTKAITSVPLRSASKTTVVASLVSAAGDAGSTVGFQSFTVTPGYLGTSTVTVKAVAAGGVVNKHDNSTLNVRIGN